MNNAMRSRERMLNAIRYQPVDHDPLYLRLWSMGKEVDNIPFPWRDQVVRAENLLSLGVVPYCWNHHWAIPSNIMLTRYQAYEAQ